MAQVLISYDLHRPTKDYPKVWAYLEGIGARRVLESVWIAKTDLTCVAICEALNKITDSDDRLFVCRFDLWAAVKVLNDVPDWLNGKA